jgi:hypothetical protein
MSFTDPNYNGLLEQPAMMASREYDFSRLVIGRFTTVVTRPGIRYDGVLIRATPSSITLDDDGEHHWLLAVQVAYVKQHDRGAV